MERKEELFNYLMSINSNSLLKEFIYNDSIPEECAMLIFGEGVNELSDVFKQIDSKFEILTVTDSISFSFINSKIARTTLVNNGNYFLFYGRCLEFDTQVVSYLANIILGKKLEKDIFYSMNNFVELFKIPQFDFSCFPYYFENSIKISEIKDEMLKTLACFEYFNNEVEKELKYPISIDNLPKNYIKSAKKFLKNCSKMAKDEHFKNLYDIYKTIYCLLLKTVIIEFSCHKTLKNKIMLLIHFINHQLGIFLEREIAVCYGYLKKIHEIHDIFFKKVQTNSNNILHHLKGMAWDLTHIRMLEYLTAVDYEMTGKLFFHYLVTFDKGLREVMKYYPIDRILFYKATPYVKFKYPLNDFINEININEEWINNKATRHTLFRDVNLNALIKTLEKELTDIQSSAHVK